MPSSAHGAAAASSAVRKGKFKEGGREPSSKAAHAQSSSTPHRQRLPGDHGRSSRGVQWTTLSARYGRISAWRNAFSKLPPVPPARLLSQRAQNELRQLTELFPRSQASLCTKPLHLRLLIKYARKQPLHRPRQLIQFCWSLAVCRRD